jgi:hypothetical protein
MAYIEFYVYDFCSFICMAIDIRENAGAKENLRDLMKQLDKARKQHNW